MKKSNENHSQLNIDDIRDEIETVETELELNQVYN
jgi:hypothetical protein